MKPTQTQFSLIVVETVKYFFFAFVIGLIVWAGPRYVVGPLSGDALTTKRAALAILYASISFLVMMISFFIFFIWIKIKNPGTEINGELIQKLQLRTLRNFKEFQTRNLYWFLLGLILIAFVLVLYDSFG